MLYIFIVLYMINVFYNQHLVSHYKKPVFEKVLFYILHRKKTGQRPNWGLLLAEFGHPQNELSPSLYFLFISHSDRLVLGLQYEPVNFSLIPKLIFFRYHLSVIAGARPLSYSLPTHSHFLIHFIHLMRHKFSLSGLVTLPLLSQCWKPKASPSFQDQPPFAFLIIHLYTLQ